MNGNRTTEQAIAELRKTVRDAFSGESVSILVEGHAIMRAIDAVEAATLGSNENRISERLRGVASDMRNIGASSMTPHELFAYWAREVDKAAAPITEENMAAHGWVRERTCHSIDPIDSSEFFVCSNCNYGAGIVEVIPNYCQNCEGRVIDERQGN